MHVAFVHCNSSDKDEVEAALQKLGHDIALFTDLDVLLKRSAPAPYDLVVLHADLGLARILDALAVLSSTSHQAMPSLVIGRIEDRTNIAMLLDGGADDVIELPSASAVLVARVTALLRRVYPARLQEAGFSVGAYDLSPFHRTVRVGGAPADLTDTEARLALLLFTNIGRTLSRSQIFAMVWGRAARQVPRTIDTHMSRLRVKLGLHEQNGVVLRGVYNAGYRLELSAHQRTEQGATVPTPGHAS